MMTSAFVSFVRMHVFFLFEPLFKFVVSIGLSHGFQVTDEDGFLQLCLVRNLMARAARIFGNILQRCRRRPEAMAIEN